MNARPNPMPFEPPVNAPIGYMQRTRQWYLALGYANPYRWAHYSSAPFGRLRKPLAQATVALLTTGVPFDAAKGPQGPGAPYNAAAKFYAAYARPSDVPADIRIAHVAIDRTHTSMQDSNSWFPLAALRRAEQRGDIGRLAPRFYGIPTNRSQRRTIQVDAPEALRLCRQDQVDAAILVPNCPVCHQVMSLTSRHLEAHGIATVVMGCAKDIVEHCAVPRFVFSDFPLGNSAGKPHSTPSQDHVLALALRLLERAPGPQTTLKNPERWADTDDWKLDYCNAARYTAAQLQQARKDNDRAKAILREVRHQAIGS